MLPFGEDRRWLRTLSEQVEVPKPLEQLESQPQTEVHIFFAQLSTSLQ